MVDENPKPEQTLLSYLRLNLRLCGTKLGCAEGSCGACTVMVSFVDPFSKKIRHISLNGCLAPVVSMHGMAVTTVEGIGSTRGKLHAVQQRMADSHGSQCGFCTPGIVMSMYALLRNNPKPNMKDIEDNFTGNLCRCTGYRPILEGFKTFTETWAQNNPSLDSGCCGKTKEGKCCMEGNDEPEPQNSLFNPGQFQPYDPSQEPIFPPELKLNHEKYFNTELEFQSDKILWFRPTNLSRLLELKGKYPQGKLAAGCTELALDMKFKGEKIPIMMHPNAIKEMNEVIVNENSITIGAAVTQTVLEATFPKLIQKMDKSRTKILVELMDMYRWFGGKQIKNVASIGGNVINGSPIADLNPILKAAGTMLKLSSVKGTRMVPLDHQFYTDYKTNILTDEEVLVSLDIPFTSANEYFYAYKQCRRRDDDIAIVNAGFYFDIQDAIVKDCRMAIGGMAKTVTMPRRTMSFVIGKKFTEEFMKETTDKLLQEMKLHPGVPGGMERYRQTLMLSMLNKAFMSMGDETGLFPLDAESMSAVERFHKDPIESHQFYEITSGSENVAPIGKPIKHKSATKQATGEAVYLDDLPRLENEIYMELVISDKAHAEIVSIDISEAEKVDGFLKFFCSDDIEDKNNEFHVVLQKDEVIFAKNKVNYMGQVIGVVLAKDKDSAEHAAKVVKVTYKDLAPVIITMEDAIEAKSYHEWSNNLIKRGNVEKVFKDKDLLIVEGELKTGAQDHFYLETHAVLAVPTMEDGEMQIFASTQNASETQLNVAHALNLPMNKVTVKVKRMGGGFGGKETRGIPLAMAAAFAADKMGRPVRIMLDRYMDMITTGTRHPFMGKYKFALTKEGVIKAMEMDLYCNAGWTMDLSFSVMERAMTHADNSYKIENALIRGHCCKTNLPSNTAFRGFGGPQGMFFIENALDAAAVRLKMKREDIRLKNMYNFLGEITHFNQPIENCTLRKCWEECLKMSEFDKRKAEIEDFNSKNKYKKRGICILPVKFGIAFGVTHLNQSGALVQIYKDGSVLLTHGGTEMGQGLHTKVIQVAAQTLKIPHEKIHITETNTDKVPNTSATAASCGSDLNGAAVLNACQILMDRLKPIFEANPNATWEEIIDKAYFARISLSTTGFYATPNLNFNYQTVEGNLYSYFTFGAGCTTVEIDALTGDHKILSTDIVMDLGESLNPAIDIGQIEGAFTQGYGLFVMEQVVHCPTGKLYTTGPGTYKIPSFGDIPSQFRVALLRGASNPRAVYSSKAVGEPPLFLGASVYFAIKEAIRAARGPGKEDFRIDAPATAERIRMACEDEFTERVAPMPKKGLYRSWSIQA